MAERSDSSRRPTPRPGPRPISRARGPADGQRAIRRHGRLRPAGLRSPVAATRSRAAADPEREAVRRSPTPARPTAPTPPAARRRRAFGDSPSCRRTGPAGDPIPAREGRPSRDRARGSFGGPAHRSDRRDRSGEPARWRIPPWRRPVGPPGGCVRRTCRRRELFSYRDDDGAASPRDAGPSRRPSSPHAAEAPSLLIVPHERRQALERLVLHATYLVRIPVVEVEAARRRALAPVRRPPGRRPRRRTADGSPALDDRPRAEPLERRRAATACIVLVSLEDPPERGHAPAQAQRPAGVHGVRSSRLGARPRWTPAAAIMALGRRGPSSTSLHPCSPRRRPARRPRGPPTSGSRLCGRRRRGGGRAPDQPAASADLRGPARDVVVGQRGPGALPQRTVVRRGPNVGSSGSRCGARSARSTPRARARDAPLRRRGPAPSPGPVRGGTERSTRPGDVRRARPMRGRASREPADRDPRHGATAPRHRGRRADRWRRLAGNPASALGARAGGTGEHPLADRRRPSPRRCPGASVALARASSRTRASEKHLPPATRARERCRQAAAEEFPPPAPSDVPPPGGAGETAHVPHVTSRHRRRRAARPRRRPGSGYGPAGLRDRARKRVPEAGERDAAHSAAGSAVTAKERRFRGRRSRSAPESAAGRCRTDPPEAPLASPSTPASRARGPSRLAAPTVSSPRRFEGSPAGTTLPPRRRRLNW
jgi:hypothetical protein